MKKTKTKKTPISKSEEVLKVDELKALLPRGIAYILFIAWMIFVFSNYYSKFPADLLGGFFADAGSISIGKFLPRIGESLWNSAVAFAIIISGFAAGDFLSKKLQIGSSFSEKFVFSTTLGLGALAIATFLSGLAGFLNKTFFIMLILALTIVGILRIWPKLGTIKILSFSLTEKLGIFLIFFIAFFNLLGALTPETFYDSMYYQLGIPAKWIFEGKITSNVYKPSSFFPLNVNMLYMVAMLLNNEITAKVLHWLLGLLITFGVYVFCKKYFSKKIGVFAALIFYSVILVMVVSWKSAIELGIGVFEFAAVFALINFFEDKERKWLVLSGVFCGFSLGSKYTSIVFCFLPATAAIFLWGVLKKDLIFDIVKNLSIFATVSFVVSSPWYIRNIICSGNPVFPFFWQSIGFLSLRETGSLFADPSRPPVSLLNTVGFLWPLTMGTLQQESFPGVVFLVFTPLLFLFKGADKKIKLLGAYLFFSLLFWALVGRFYLRYFIPTLPVAGIILSYYILRQSASNFFKNIMLLIVMYISLTNLNYASRILKITQDPFSYVSGNMTKKEYLSISRSGYPAPYYQTLSWANDNLPKDSKILFIGETRGLYSKLDFFTNGAGDFSYFIEWLKKSKSPESFYAILKENGVTHILLNLPEASRLSGYEPFYMEPEDLKVFDGFWKKYPREIYKDIADYYLPEKDIKSMKTDRPLWWKNYSDDPKNYVYLYEILSEDEAKSKPAPFNFLLFEGFYTKKRWQILEETASALLGKSR